MNLIISIASITISILLASCSGGGDDGNSMDSGSSGLLTGKFIDSEVFGLGYTTASQSGRTNESGEYSYIAGETVVFSIGDIGFPPVQAISFITPLDVFSTADINNVGVENMARLLQTLDLDGMLDNGITISDTAHMMATGLQLDFFDATFDSIVTNLVANSGAVATSLITADDAKIHLQQSIDNLNLGAVCSANHALIGTTAQFSELAHGVSGQATLIDDCTILISQFNYDGGGPLVYFYAGTNGDYSASSAFAISGLISGTSYSNAEIIIKLPRGKTVNDFNGISVWCVEFEANFGEAIF